jgi:hypothetical protein
MPLMEEIEIYDFFSFFSTDLLIGDAEVCIIELILVFEGIDYFYCLFVDSLIYISDFLIFLLKGLSSSCLSIFFCKALIY